jgi:hypothetical protein
MARCLALQGSSGWLGRLTASLTMAMSFCLGACQPFLLPAAPRPSGNQSNDLAGVTIAAAPARRLLVTRDESQSGSRVLAIWIRVENTEREILTFNPDDVLLRFADGSASYTLDRDRSNALIERVVVAPTDEAAAEYPDLWTRTRQPSLKQQLNDGLLTQRPLGSEAVEGYILFDTKQRAASIDGASLQILLIRSDGTALRPLYHFAGAARSAARIEQPQTGTR